MKQEVSRCLGFIFFLVLYNYNSEIFSLLRRVLKFIENILLMPLKLIINLLKKSHGWHRIWIFFTGFYLIICFYFNVPFDCFSNIIMLSLLIFIGIETTVFKKIINYVVGNNKNRDAGDRFLFSFGKFWLVFILGLSAYVILDSYFKYLLLPIVLYVLGWSLGWIYKGFRKSKAINIEGNI